MSYGTFELTLYPPRPGSTDYPVTAIYRSPANENLVADPPAHEIFRCDDRMRRRLADQIFNPRAYGHALGDALFVGPVGVRTVAFSPTGSS
jgi:hypothetical protein